MRVLCILAGLSGLYVLYFWRLGVCPLLPPNEGLYSEIAREMNETGDYVTPHANHLRYYEKPPLLYWCTAAAFRLFGEDEFSARVTSATAGVATVLVTLLIGRLLGGPGFGLMSAAVCGSALGMVGMCRLNMFDPMLTLWTTVAYLGFVVGYVAPRRGWGYLLCAAALGLGVMTKGVIALAITMPGLVAIVSVTRGWRRWREMMLWQSVSVFLLIVAPWHVIMSLRDPNFVWFYFVNETLHRLVGTRIPADYSRGPLTYYIWRDLATFAPWSLLLPAAVAVWPRRQGRSAAPQPDYTYLLAIAWFAWPLVLFSLSANKANYYLLPTFPAQALLVARLLRLLNGGRTRGRLLRGAVTASFVLLAAGAGFGIARAEAHPHPVIESLDTLARAQVDWALRATAGLWIVGAITGIFFRPRTRAIWPLALSTMTLVLALGFVAEERWYELGGERAAEVASQYAGADAEIMLDMNYEEQSTVAFHLHRRLRCIDARSGDLWYGSTLEPSDEWFPTSSEVLERVRAGDRIVIVSDFSWRTEYWTKAGGGRIVDRGDFGGSRVLTANLR